MVTIYEIAAEAGVSPNTVSRVLNGQLKGNYPKVAAKASRILEIAQRMQYRPNAAARAMQSRATRQVGVLIRNRAEAELRFIGLSTFEYIVGINEAVAHAGYVASLIHIDEVNEGLRGTEQSRVFRERMLDGMIVVNVIPQSLPELLPEVMPKVVWCDTDVMKRTGCLQRDESAAGRLAAEALLEGGCERLIWMGPTLEPYATGHYSHPARYEAALAVASAAGLALDDGGSFPWVYPVGTPRDHALADMIRQHPRTGIVATSTPLARWIGQSMPPLGLVPGQQFGLACCDEDDDLRIAWPGLSRAAFDRWAMGHQAGHMLLNMIEGGEADSVRIDVQWIPGHTAQVSRF